MSALLKRLAKLASPSWRRRHFEWKRLAALPRYQAGTSGFFGTPTHFADAASFLSAGAEIFEREIYRFPSEAPAPRIVDGGANIGLAVLYLKQLYPRARITALEPDPGIAAVLRRNLDAWGFPDVELERKALGTAEGRLRFVSEGADGGHLGSAPAGSRQIEVETVPLSHYLQEPVDFLKLDIEGAETEVLEAARPFLGSVRRIFVEYHSFAGQPQTLGRVISILQEAGFRLHLHPCLTSASPFAGVVVSAGMDMQLNLFGWRE